MKIYNYDSVTKEYISDSTADRDPLSSAIWSLVELGKTNEEISKALKVTDEAINEIRESEKLEDLLPANSTSVAPPKAVNRQARIFNGKNWEYVADFRDYEVSANDGSGRKHIISELGIKPEDVRFEKVKEKDINDTKTAAKTQLATIIDYILNPTSEKEQALLKEYERLIADAA